MSFRAYGLTIGFRSSNPSVMEQVLGRLPVGWKATSQMSVDRLYSLIAPDQRPGGRVRRFFLLYSDIIRLVRTMDLKEALNVFETDLEVYVAERARTRLFVHAGVVGWRGKAILIPGESGSGKSTLVQALVRAGATYYSDEYAVLDHRGRVHPFPRPLSLRPPGRKTSRKKAVQAVPGNAGTEPLPIRLIVLTVYRSGKHFRPRRVSQGTAVLELLRHTVAARRRPRTALATLRHAVGVSTTFRTPRGEAEAAAESVLALAEKIAAC